MDKQTESQEAFKKWWNEPEQVELRLSCAEGWGFRIWVASRESLVVEPVNFPELPDGWIKCSDELPPYETNVVMWDSRDKAPVIFNTYSEDSYTRGLKLYLAAMGMTHWKPVSPPTTEK